MSTMHSSAYGELGLESNLTFVRGTTQSFWRGYSCQ